MAFSINLYGADSMPTVATVRQTKSCTASLVSWDRSLVGFTPQKLEIDPKFNPSTTLFLDGNEEDNGYEQSTVMIKTIPQFFPKTAKYNSECFPELPIMRSKYLYILSTDYNILLAKTPTIAYRLIKDGDYQPVNDRDGFIRSMQYNFKLARGVLS